MLNVQMIVVRIFGEGLKLHVIVRPQILPHASGEQLALRDRDIMTAKVERLALGVKRMTLVVTILTRSDRWRA